MNAHFSDDEANKTEAYDPLSNTNMSSKVNSDSDVYSRNLSSKPVLYDPSKLYKAPSSRPYVQPV